MLSKDFLNKNKTAFYVFDIGEIKNRISFIKENIPKNIGICYAIKANTFVAREISEFVDRFEVCSPGEEYICDSLGIPPEKTVISGVYKTPGIIENSVKNSSDKIYTVESLNQLKLLESLSEKYGRNIKILLRLTNGSQFGINEEDIEKIIKNKTNYKRLNILGLQFFSGTQKKSLKKIKREIQKCDEILSMLNEKYAFKAQEFEYGAGFPVSYFKDESFDEKEFLNEFSAIVNGMNFNGKIYIELGRSIVASCGKYYTHIVDIKENKGENYALTDGGMHHIVYFGQYMAMKMPFFKVCGKENLSAEKNWNICGALCSMNDIICKNAPLPKIETGDTLCFENAGAYCATEGISLFLSRDLPKIYLKRINGNIVCVRDTCETAQLNMPKYERI